MGKLGKARKRRRLETEFATVAEGEVESEASDAADINDNENKQATEKLNLSRDQALAISVLDTLATRLDMYFSKPLKPLRVVLSSLIFSQRGAHFEPELAAGPPSDAAAAALLHPSGPAMVALTRLVGRFTSGELILSAAAHKPFRRALHPLVLEQIRRDGATALPDPGLSGRISTAFRHRDWARALLLLREMAHAPSHARPRLGAMQRWVRDCDLAAQPSDHGHQGQGVGDEEGTATDETTTGNDGPSAATVSTVAGGRSSAVSTSLPPPLASYSSGTGGPGSNTALLLLDAVIRAGGDTLTAGKEQTGAKGTRTAWAVGAGSAGLGQVAVLHRFPLFRGPAPVHRPSGTPLTPPLGWTKRVVEGLRVIHHVPGLQRRPPSTDDLRVYMTPPGAITFESSSSPTRHDVPGVPGAFLMDNVLSPHEADQLVHTAEAIGYTRDGIDGIGAIVWLADDGLLGPIFERCKGLLPQSIAGCALKGINARWRLFRYQPGAVYRPHIDGAWPGSGLDASGSLTDDAAPGLAISRLTFLVYLNGGFGGGATTFFLPSPAGPGQLEARGVEPSAGSVLCFPHGDAMGSLVHEGSAVEEGGVKYIIRSDVLYATRPDGGVGG